MKLLKTILHKAIKFVVTEELIQDIKYQVRKDLESIPNYREDLHKYKLKIKDFKLSIYDAFLYYDIYNIEIESTVKYFNGLEKTNKVGFSDISNLYNYCKNFNEIDFNDKDIQGFKSIKIYVWCYYKGNKNLIPEYHLDDNIYSFDAYITVINNLRLFIEKHPETLI